MNQPNQAPRPNPPIIVHGPPSQFDIRGGEAAARTPQPPDPNKTSRRLLIGGALVGAAATLALGLQVPGEAVDAANDTAAAARHGSNIKDTEDKYYVAKTDQDSQDTVQERAAARKFVEDYPGYVSTEEAAKKENRNAAFGHLGHIVLWNAAGGLTGLVSARMAAEAAKRRKPRPPQQRARRR